MTALRELIDRLECDRLLHEPAQFGERFIALDRLESLGIGDDANAAFVLEDAALQRRGLALRAAIADANERYCATLREQIRAGQTPDLLADQVAASVPAAGAGYDALDDLVAGVLCLSEPAAPRRVLMPEMVFYQPTPARHVFDLIARARLHADDVFVDLGSGLGHVPLLAAICSAARCVGIELEPAYVDCARGCARSLGLERAEFVVQDARDADLRRGTVFYLYTPFSGSILRGVLDALQREAATRAIRVCAFGPCVTTLAAEPWLCATAPTSPDAICVFHARA